DFHVTGVQTCALPISGIGILTSRNKEGSGVRVIVAGSVHGTVPEVGYKEELFDRDEENAVKYSINWAKEFGPKLVKTSDGRTYRSEERRVGKEGSTRW